MLKVYQVHFIAEIQPTIVSENKDINGQKAAPQILKNYRYVVANSTTEAKLMAYPSIIRTDDAEIYALQVSENTVLDEITHCKELIAYWNTKPKEIQEQQRVDCIIPSQQNKIKHLQTVLKELKDE